MKVGDKMNTMEIRIIRNPDMNDENAFIVYINGEPLKNIKRFAIDLDNEKLNPRTENGRLVGSIPMTYTAEFYETPNIFDVQDEFYKD